MNQKKFKRTISLFLILMFCVFMLAGTKANAAEVSTGKDVHAEELRVAYVPISTAGIMNKMVLYAFDQVLAPIRTSHLTYSIPDMIPRKKSAFLTTASHRNMMLLSVRSLTRFRLQRLLRMQSRPEFP